MDGMLVHFVFITLHINIWNDWKFGMNVHCSVDSQPTMEETVLVGDDLMLGPPSPIIPPEIASHVLEGVNLCDGILRNLFLCKFFIFISQSFCPLAIFHDKLSSHLKTLGLQVNDIEPFCQEEIALYRECAEKRV